ncbi:MAG: PLP-dependent aminotransferase family protein [Eubacteriales bacterium]|nr:PLP-dependent aminotransferase family protein [Eubacteriales bacterium]
MLTYTFTDLGSDSMYSHLYKCIKRDMIQGLIPPGEKLPSKRSFAKNLGISVITVENAYEQLIAEGYIYSIPKKGYFAANIQKRPGDKGSSRKGESFRSHTKAPGYAADFSNNQAGTEQFPFSVWAKLIRELLKDHQKEILTNPPSGGVLELRESIARHLLEFRGMEVYPEQIIVGAGTEYLYGLLIQLLGQDKCYGVENPGYQKISQIYESHGVKCRHVALEKDGVSIQDLEGQRVDVMHMSPSHHFPTGMVTPVSKRYELLGWAAKDKKRYLIEDDYDSEFRLTGRPIPSLQSIDALEKVIYINTFTKTLSSTIRISYMVLPRHLMALFYKRLSFYSCTIPNLEQYTLARFLSEGYFEKHINRMRNYYHRKRDFLLQEIYGSPLERYASISEEDAGLHFLLRLDITCTDEEFQLQMERRGIRIRALSEYFTGSVGKPEHIFVVNYSSLTEEQIKEAVSAMAEEAAKVRRKGTKDQYQE